MHAPRKQSCNLTLTLASPCPLICSYNIWLNEQYTQKLDDTSSTQWTVVVDAMGWFPGVLLVGLEPMGCRAHVERQINNRRPAPLDFNTGRIAATAYTNHIPIIDQPCTNHAPSMHQSCTNHM